VSKVDLRLQCGMPCSKLEVSTVHHGTLSGAGYLHQSQQYVVYASLQFRSHRPPVLFSKSDAPPWPVTEGCTFHHSSLSPPR
jgi:hypothetical protein